MPMHGPEAASALCPAVVHVGPEEPDKGTPAHEVLRTGPGPGHLPHGCPHPEFPPPGRRRPHVHLQAVRYYSHVSPSLYGRKLSLMGGSGRPPAVQAAGALCFLHCRHECRVAYNDKTRRAAEVLLCMSGSCGCHAELQGRTAAVRSIGQGAVCSEQKVTYPKFGSH